MYVNRLINRKYVDFFLLKKKKKKKQTTLSKMKTLYQFLTKITRYFNDMKVKIFQNNKWKIYNEFLTYKSFITKCT